VLALPIVAFVLYARQSDRSLAAAVLLPFAVCIGQLVFRRMYYGVWTPNTGLAKFSPSLDHLREGLHYVAIAGLWIPPVIICAVAALVAVWRLADRRFVLLLTVVTSSWLGYIAVVGGDIFPAHRHFVPVMVTSVLAIAAGFGVIARQERACHTAGVAGAIA